MNLFVSEAEKERLRKAEKKRLLPCTRDECRGTFAGMEVGKWYHLYPNEENMDRDDWEANPFQLLDEEYRTEPNGERVRNVIAGYLGADQRTKPIRKWGEESPLSLPGTLEFEVKYWNKGNDGSRRGPYTTTLISQDPGTLVQEVEAPNWLAEHVPILYQKHIHPEPPDQVQVSVRLDDGTIISAEELEKKRAIEEADADAAKKRSFSNFFKTRKKETIKKTGGKRKSNRRNIKSSTKKAKGRKGRKSRKNKSKAKK